MAGPVPIKFALSVAAGLGVEASLLLCWKDKILSLSVLVSFEFSVYGSASLSVLVAEVGIQMSVGTSLEISKAIGYSKGNLCNNFKYDLKPIYIQFDAFRSLLWFEKSMTIWTFSPVEFVFKKKIENEQKFIELKQN